VEDKISYQVNEILHHHYRCISNYFNQSKHFDVSAETVKALEPKLVQLV